MRTTPRPARAPHASARQIAEVAGGRLAFVDGAPRTPRAPDAPGPDEDVTLQGVTLDSRLVVPGDLYAALPGRNAHGATYGAGAAAAGAAAVLTDPAGADVLHAAGVTLPRIVVPDPRGVLGVVSASLYGRPADGMVLVGITGTNGKTTTAYILEAALRALGRRTGLIGTIEVRLGEESIPAVRTTPESCDLHGLFAAMRERDVTACVMEVSSHALALHRVDGVRYDVALFTNLSQDHLDFHGTMADYYAAKASLFTPERAVHGVVCVDDEWGARLAREATIPVTTLATRPEAAGLADGGPVDWILTPAASAGVDGFDLVAVASGRRLNLRAALPGDYNEANTAMAALALLTCAVAPADVEAALAAGATVPGRMERVDLGGGAPTVYVDFAHTPEAIRATLAALRPTVGGGRLVAVLGAGGNRDRGKRPLMGEAAARGADVVVVTDDNPRDEDPAAIRADIASGARAAGGPGVPVLDIDRRAEGIARALRLAAPGDVVAVLGRGHETRQEVMGSYRPFDDRQAVRTAWAEVRGS